MFKRSWCTACPKARVSGRIFHDFRRTAVRNLERAGVPRAVAMKLTGHKAESIYRRYDIVSENDLNIVVERLNNYSGQQLKSGISARIELKWKLQITHLEGLEWWAVQDLNL